MFYIARFTHSLARGKVKDQMAIFTVFFFVLDHSVMAVRVYIKFCAIVRHFSIGFPQRNGIRFVCGSEILSC